jgi:DNA polymerase-3 subunit gamma/tau
MRDALSLLDQAIAFSAGQVEEMVVRSMLGTVDQSYLFDLLGALREQSGTTLLKISDEMAARSIAFDVALQELATLLHRIALAQAVPQAIVDDEPERERLLELAQAFTAEDVQMYYQIAIYGRDEIDLAPDEYAGFTMTMLRMLAFAPAKGAAQSTLTAPVVAAKPSERSTAASKGGPAPAETASLGLATSNVMASVNESASGRKPDWNLLIEQINVQGMAQQLAKHCTLKNLSDRQITLCLSKEQRHLQTNKMAAEKLQTCLSEYFAKPIKLSIILGESEAATPAVTEQQIKLENQQQASDSIAQDDFVRDAQTELNAVLVAESIKRII